jgi:hypothetical protein
VDSLALSSEEEAKHVDLAAAVKDKVLIRVERGTEAVRPIFFFNNERTLLNVVSPFVGVVPPTLLYHDGVWTITYKSAQYTGMLYSWLVHISSRIALFAHPAQLIEALQKADPELGKTSIMVTQCPVDEAYQLCPPADEPLPLFTFQLPPDLASRFHPSRDSIKAQKVSIGVNFMKWAIVLAPLASETIEIVPDFSLSDLLIASPPFSSSSSISGSSPSESAPPS